MAPNLEKKMRSRAQGLNGKGKMYCSGAEVKGERLDENQSTRRLGGEI